MTTAEPTAPRVLYAEFTAKPGHEETVAQMIADLGVLVRQEPGNVEFVPYRREDDSARFFVYEIYRDENAFQAHISADYGAVFNEKLAPLIIEPHSQLTWLDPV